MAKTERPVDTGIFSVDCTVSYDSTVGPHTLHVSGHYKWSVGDAVTVLYLPENPSKGVFMRVKKAWVPVLV